MTDPNQARLHHAGSREPREDERQTLLTPRQRQCLCWAQLGKSSSDIGDILGISPRTVDEHIATACARLNVRTRIQAVQRASALGLLDCVI